MFSPSWIFVWRCGNFGNYSWHWRLNPLKSRRNRSHPCDFWVVWKFLRISIRSIRYSVRFYRYCVRGPWWTDWPCSSNDDDDEPQNWNFAGGAKTALEPPRKFFLLYSRLRHVVVRPKMVQNSSILMAVDRTGNFGANSIGGTLITDGWGYRRCHRHC